MAMSWESSVMARARLLCGTGKCSSEQTLPMCCHLEELITGSVVPLLTIHRELLKPCGKAWAASG